MAAKEAEAAADEGAAEQAAPVPSEPKGPLLVALLNTLLVLGTLGFFAYTRLVFKRPAITEEGERTRIQAMQASAKANEVSGLINFEPMTVNIRPETARSKPGEAVDEQDLSKMHYVTLGFSLEIRDMARTGEIEKLRPIILDQLLSMIGRKSYSELVTVQGRYLLRTAILDSINGLLKGEGELRKTAVVTNVFLTQFVVQ